MRGAASLIITVVMSALAGALAFAAWEYSRELLRAALSGPVRAFVLDFGFVISLVAVFLVLSLAERVLGAIASRRGGGG